MGKNYYFLVIRKILTRIVQIARINVINNSFQTLDFLQSVHCLSYYSAAVQTPWPKQFIEGSLFTDL